MCWQCIRWFAYLWAVMHVISLVLRVHWLISSHYTNVQIEVVLHNSNIWSHIVFIVHSRYCTWLAGFWVLCCFHVKKRIIILSMVYIFLLFYFRSPLAMVSSVCSIGSICSWFVWEIPGDKKSGMGRGVMSNNLIINCFVHYYNS